jgi:hypothetical protein
MVHMQCLTANGLGTCVIMCCRGRRCGAEGMLLDCQDAGWC